MITSAAFAGKRYAVLGLARSGAAAVATLVASGAEVTAWDAREEPRALAAARHPGLELADPCAIDLTGYAALVVSPGVPLNRHPVADVAANFGVPLICDIELFAQARPSLPAHRVIGITGTNGKSTTTALVHHLLKSAGLPTRMGGNIGLPVLEQDPLPAGGVYVLELSSFQIDLTHSLSCDAAALLNITPDHLDRYAGFAEYAQAKARLFAMQDPAAPAIFGLTDAETGAIAGQEAQRRGAAGASGTVRMVDGAELAALQADWASLQGPHNLQNAAVAVALVEALGITPAQWRPALATFRGLPHRMEQVGEASGVSFINDSKATNPASAAPALAAFPPVAGHRRVHWIVGGLPQGDRLDECEAHFGNVAAAYCIGDAGPRFAELLAPAMPVHRSEMMCEAIREAIAHAAPGDVVLLSPACASFDQFRDYEARGDAFRQIVAALTDPEGEAGVPC